MGKDKTRDDILNAAGEIFAAKGFKAATVRDICRQADVNVAAVNYYFGDKERLYIEAVKNAHRLREREEPMPDWSDATPAPKKLRFFIATMLRRMLGEKGTPWQTRLILREIMEPTKACEELVHDAFQPYFHMLLGILREMLPAGTPEYRIYQLGFTVIGQCVYYRVNHKIVSLLVPPDELQQHYGVEQLAEHIAEVSLGAIGAEPTLCQRLGDVFALKGHNMKAQGNALGHVDEEISQALKGRHKS